MDLGNIFAQFEVGDYNDNPRKSTFNDFSFYDLYNTKKITSLIFRLNTLFIIFIIFKMKLTFDTYIWSTPNVFGIGNRLHRSILNVGILEIFDTTINQIICNLVLLLNTFFPGKMLFISLLYGSLVTEGSTNNKGDFLRAIEMFFKQQKRIKFRKIRIGFILNIS